MIRLTLTVIGLLALAPDPDPARQFDFWCGTWSIQNQRTLPTGERLTGPATLTVRPILGGNAILERAWEGLPEGDMKDTFGMSLRFYDERLERWVVILSWPGGDPVAARFGRMEGAFIDVDGDLQCHLYPPAVFTGPGFDPPDEFPSRFIFSEATEDSLRWRLDVPWNGRVITPWDMRFTRTADPIPAGAPLRIAHPPDDCACEQPEARALDWLVGQWTSDANDSTITLRASSATRGCSTYVSISRNGAQQRFAVLAYVPGAGEWQAHSLDAETHHAAWRGTWTPDIRSLRLTASQASHPDRAGQRLTLTQTGDDTLTLTIDPPDPDSAPNLHATLSRTPR